MKNLSLSLAMCVAAVIIFLFALKGRSGSPESASTSSLNQEGTSAVDQKDSNSSRRNSSSGDGDEEEEKELIEWTLEAKPFPIAHQTEQFSWADADGLDPTVVRQLTRYPEHEEVLLEQRVITKRRQLVYLPSDFTETTDKLYRGELLEVTIPGFDGEEFIVKLDEAVEPEIYEDDPTVMGTFTGSIFRKDGTPLGVSASAAIVDGHWSLGFDYNGGRYVYENRGDFNDEWIISELEVAKIDDFISGKL